MIYICQCGNFEVVQDINNYNSIYKLIMDNVLIKRRKQKQKQKREKKF